MNVNQLIVQLNFKQIYFKGIRFDKQTLTNSIDHLAKHLNLHIRSASPFILLATYNHIKSLIAYYAIIKAGKNTSLDGSRLQIDRTY